MSSLTTNAPGDAQAMGTQGAPRVGVPVLGGFSAAFVALMGFVALPAYLAASAASFDVVSLAWLVAAGILVPVGLATVARRFGVSGASTRVDAAGVDAPAMAALRPEKRVVAAHVADGRDALTGLLDRDGFVEELARQVELATDGDFPLSLAILDVDRLAGLNEKLGREAGDRLLAGLGRLVEDQTRADDHAFRLGGDEFAILMPRCGAGRAQSVLRRLLLATLEADDRRDAPEWSFSAGISSYPELSASGSALRRDAQAALSWAKQHGRTDVQLFDAFRDLTDEQRRDEHAVGASLADDDFTSGEHGAAPLQLRFLGSTPPPARSAEWVDPRLVLIGLAEDPEERPNGGTEAARA